MKRYEQLAEAALQGIYEFSKPTIACIRGYCIGGGDECGDQATCGVASSDSVFSIRPRGWLGLGYSLSAMKNLVQLVGPGYAKDIFFTGRRLDAAEALRLGSLSRGRAAGLEALLAEVHDCNHHGCAAHHQGGQADQSGSVEAPTTSTPS